METLRTDLPNQCWQADVTHWRLADHSDVEILDIIDDHPRVAIASVARPVTTGPDVVDTVTAGTRQRSCRQRGHLHRHTPTRRPHRPTNPAGRTRHHLHQLPALPPADLRKSGTLPLLGY